MGGEGDSVILNPHRVSARPTDTVFTTNPNSAPLPSLSSS